MKKRTIVVGGFLLAAVAVALLADAGRFLVVDAPRKADVILVLAGETDRRPARALQLLRQGYAGKVLIDVPATDKIYGYSSMELAQNWIQTLPERGAVRICPIRGLSTKDEARDASLCLATTPGRSILLVTSDYHTRRALSVFQRMIPEHDFSVAAAYDATEFGTPWWHQRQWAKICLDEWLRLVWWKAVDEWR